MRRTVIAIGGNSLLMKGQRGTASEQLENARTTCQALLPLIRTRQTIITHGNGPQVGAILLQNEGCEEVPAMPLDVCGAQSQGMIGYIIQQAMANVLDAAHLDLHVATVVTQVLVNPRDKAFKSPSKPVGPYMSEIDAKRKRREEGWAVRQIEGGTGWRRLVPSPIPIGIVEGELVQDLAERGDTVIIACGGGGIPVVENRRGIHGVEAVIDKDLASMVLAKQVGAQEFIMLTDEDAAYVDYDSPQRRRLGVETVKSMRRHLGTGQFPPGSMGPKVEAAIGFLEAGGETSIITNASSLEKALKKKAGTTILP